MIHVDNGGYEVNGNKITLLAEFSSTLASLKRKGMFDDADIDEICRVAKLSDEGLHTESSECLAKIAAECALDKILNEILNK